VSATIDIRASEPVCSGEASGERLDLSALDVFEYPIPIDVGYIYRDKVDVGELEESLRATLRHYPELTGRLRSDGKKTGRLYVACEDQGARLVSATSDIEIGELTDDELGAVDLSPYFAKNKWLRCRDRDVPLLVVQHTETACGGMILGVQTAHALADGEALVAFMCDWARVHRGGQVRRATMSRLDYQGHFGVREPAADDPDRVPGFKRMGRMMLMWKVLKLAWDSRSTISTVLRFSTAELLAMRRLARSRSETASATNALLAHLWQVFAGLRPNRDDDPTGLFCVLGTRHLGEGAVDSHYFGNAVWHQRAESTYGEVRTATLGELTAVVGEAQAALGYDQVCEGMQWLENERARRNLELGVVPDYALMRRDFFATNMYRLPMYDPDFGTGRPAWVNTMPPPVRWMIRLFPTPSRRGVDVHCTVPRAWRRLLADHQVEARLRRYAEGTP
jgi:shikimate O-hydroxycinnamoyltransferase